MSLTHMKDLELQRRLIDSGRRVGDPSPMALERTLERIEAAALAGLFGAATSAGSASAATIGATTSAKAAGVSGLGATVGQSIAGGSTAPAAKAVATAVVSKWFLSGVAVGIIAGGAGWTITASLPVLSASIAHRPSSMAAQIGVKQAASVSPVGQAEPSQRSLPDQRIVEEAASGKQRSPVTLRVMPARAAPTGASKTESDGINPELARELRLVDRARGCIERADASGALHWLDEHRRQFPNGQLTPEARVLRDRAEALAASRNE